MVSVEDEWSREFGLWVLRGLARDQADANRRVQSTEGLGELWWGQRLGTEGVLMGERSAGIEEGGRASWRAQGGCQEKAGMEGRKPGRKLGL